MNKRRSSMVLSILVLAALMLVSGLQLTPLAAAAEPEPVHGGTLRITHYQTQAWLDIHQGVGVETQMFGVNIWESLVAQDPSRVVVPKLAEKWEISSDGTTYTFHLRQGVKFHNGKELKAEDVVYSIKRLADPAVGQMASRYKPMASVEAVDDYTVKITTTGSWAPFLATLAHPWSAIYPKDYVPSESAGYIGTGPFKIESAVTGEEVIMVRNPDYWDAGPNDLPYLDRVEWHYISDEMGRVGVLLSGESDLIYTPPHSARAGLEADPNLTIFPGYAQPEGIALSTYNVEAFANPLVREAVDVALNRQEIVNVALDGIGQPVVGDWEPAGSWVYYDKEMVPPAGDLQRASELLKEAGYGDGFSFTLSTWEQWPTEVKTAQLIQQWFKQLNIDVKIEHVDEGVWVDKVYKGNIDAAFQGLFAAVEPDTDVRNFAHPTDAIVTSIWDNKTIATMIDDAAREMDQAKRAQKYHDLIEALHAHGKDSYTPFLMLWIEPQDIVLNTGRVNGFWDDGFGNLSCLKDLWITE